MASRGQARSCAAASATLNGTVPLAQTPTVEVLPGPATALAFTAQPSNTMILSRITPPVRVTAFDAFGNMASGFADNFDRDQLGEAWNNTGGPYAIHDGKLTMSNARNKPLWLRRTVVLLGTAVAALYLWRAR